MIVAVPVGAEPFEAKLVEISKLLDAATKAPELGDISKDIEYLLWEEFKTPITEEWKRAVVDAWLVDCQIPWISHKTTKGPLRL